MDGGRWSEIARGVYRRRDERFALNVGLVVGDGAALLVDTRSSAREGEVLRDEVRRRFRVDVAAVVNTHAHFDHCFGNAAFSDAILWGHAGCAQALRDDGERLRAEALTHAGGDAGFAADVRATTLAPPRRTFADDVTLRVGGRTVRLRHLGRGHTDHDVVVEVGDVGVLFAGDLVESSGPPACEDAWPLDWPDTLARVLELVAGPVVPGHGEPVDAAFVVRQRDELAALADLARGVLAGTLDVPAARRASPLPEEATRLALARAEATARRP